MKLDFSRKIFRKSNQILKFLENQSIGSRVVPRGQTDITKLRTFKNDMNGIRTEYHRVRGQNTVHTPYVVLGVSSIVTCERIKTHKMEYYQGHLSLFLRPQALRLGIRRGTPITNNSATILDGTFKRRICSFLFSNPSTN